MSDSEIKRLLQAEWPRAKIRKQGNNWLVSWTDQAGWHGVMLNGQKVLEAAKRLDKAAKLA